MKNKSYVKSTKEGKLYIETKDFFSSPKIQNTIKKLMESEVVKKLNSRKV